MKVSFFLKGTRPGSSWCAVGSCRSGGLAGLWCHHCFQPLAAQPPQQPGNTSLCGNRGGWDLASRLHHGNSHVSHSSCSSLISALLSSYHLPDRSLSAGWIGLVGRRGPRSKQPFMVTFFRENQVPCRPPRAVKPHPRRKKPKYDLPVPSIQS